jgi:hypothetical protein
VGSRSLDHRASLDIDTPTVVALARRALILAAFVSLVGAAPSAASGSVRIGIGEQSASMFTDSRWQRLGIRHARYLTPWDALDHRRQRAELDTWMAAARSAEVRVMLSFRHSRRARRDASRFPTTRMFRRAFLGFRKRYPDVRDFIVWNEANHPLSFSSDRPGRVAKLFDVAARNCARCRVIGADVLDIRGMTAWVRAFTRHAEERPRIWGLHNYVDARNRRSAATLALLAATRGDVWFTETGGWLLRRKYKRIKQRRQIVQQFRLSPRKAARATRHALHLSCLSRRIRRVYLYNWQAPRVATTWDSGLIGRHGRPRPAYDVLRRHVRRTGAPVVRCRQGLVTHK